MSSVPSQVPTPPPPPSGAPAQLGGYAAQGAPTNSLAIVSLVTGIGSFFAHIIPGVGGLTVALVAIITGFMARGQIKRSGEQGMWMANAGIIIGIVHLVMIFLVVIVLLFLIFVLGIALFGIATHGGGATPSPAPSG